MWNWIKNFFGLGPALDVNKDGKVNTADVTAAAKVVEQKADASIAEFKAKTVEIVAKGAALEDKLEQDIKAKVEEVKVEAAKVEAVVVKEVKEAAADLSKTVDTVVATQEKVVEAVKTEVKKAKTAVKKTASKKNAK